MHLSSELPTAYIMPSPSISKQFFLTLISLSINVPVSLILPSHMTTVSPFTYDIRQIIPLPDTAKSALLLTYLSLLSAGAGILVALSGYGHPYFGCFFLLFCGVLTLLFRFIEKKLDYYKG